jgi:hypothetical protein
MSLATTESLIWASSSSLLHPLGLGGAHPDQIGPVAGQVPQPPDRRGRHEAGPQHAPLGDLTKPHRIQLVGLGPPRQMLDIAGVDQPDLQPLGLQQVEHRPPIVRRRLHHHPGHPQLSQPVRQHQQRPGHRLVGRHLLQPLTPPARTGYPDAAAQLLLADIQRRDPSDELLGLLGLLQHPASSPCGQQRWLPAGATGTGRS